MNEPNQRLPIQALARCARPVRAALRLALGLAVNEKSGQVLPWVAFMMMLFLGMGAFVLDAGHAYFCYRQLQAATDAAALAGARQIYTSSAVATASAYAATSGGHNTYSTLQNVTMVSGYPKTECLTTMANLGILCEGPNSANAIQVKQTATVPTFFAQIFGIGTMNLVATATASKGQAVPLNVAMIIDTTMSADGVDSNCGSLTEIACSLAGAQTLLQGLAPTIDAVSVFTFPAESTATVGNNSSCTPPQSITPGEWTTPVASLGTAEPYTFPTLPSNASTGYVVPSGYGTYQVTGFNTNYRTSNAGKTPNANSTVVKALGAPSVNGSAAVGGCLAPPNQTGVFGTYLPGVIYAAQAALAAEKASEVATAAAGTPTPVNVMIVLSDGNSNASTHYPGVTQQFFQTTPNATGVYPSDVGDCGQTVVAAQAAKTAGTLIFSIAYGSQATGYFNWNSSNKTASLTSASCGTDQDSFFTAFNLGANKSAYPNISPCQTMKDIASPDTATTQFFYSDYNQSGSNSQCYSSNAASATGLNDIFASITGNLSVARLIPDGTT